MATGAGTFSAMFRCSHRCLAVLILAVIGCSDVEPAVEPIAVGAPVEEAELAAFIEARLGAARMQPSSGLVRGLSLIHI